MLTNGYRSPVSVSPRRPIPPGKPKGPVSELSVNLSEFDRCVSRVKTSHTTAASQFWSSLRLLLEDAHTALHLPEPHSHTTAHSSSIFIDSTNAMLEAATTPSRRFLQFSMSLVNPNELSYLTGVGASMTAEQLLLAARTGAAEVVLATTCENCAAVVSEANRLENLPETSKCKVCGDTVTLQKLSQVKAFFRFDSSIIHSPMAMPRCVESVHIKAKMIDRFFVPRDSGDNVTQGYSRTIKGLKEGRYTIFDPTCGVQRTLVVKAPPPPPKDYELALDKKLAQVYESKLRRVVSLRINEASLNDPQLPESSRPSSSSGSRTPDTSNLPDDQQLLWCHEGDITLRIFNDTKFSGFIGLYHQLDLRTEAYVDEPPNYFTFEELLLHPSYDIYAAHLEATRPKRSGLVHVVEDSLPRSLQIDHGFFVSMRVGSAAGMLKQMGDAASLEALHSVRRLLTIVAGRHLGRIFRFNGFECMLLFRNAGAAVAFCAEAVMQLKIASDPVAFVKDEDDGGSKAPAIGPVRSKKVLNGVHFMNIVLHAGSALMCGSGAEQRLTNTSIECFGKTINETMFLQSAAKQTNEDQWVIVDPESSELSPLHMSTVVFEDKDTQGVMSLLQEHLHLEVASPKTIHVPEGVHTAAAGMPTKDIKLHRVSFGSGASTAELKTKLDMLHPSVYEAPLDLTGLFNSTPRDDWPSPAAL